MSKEEKVLEVFNKYFVIENRKEGHYFKTKNVYFPVLKIEDEDFEILKDYFNLVDKEYTLREYMYEKECDELCYFSFTIFKTNITVENINYFERLYNDKLLDKFKVISVIEGKRDVGNNMLLPEYILTLEEIKR